MSAQCLLNQTCIPESHTISRASYTASQFLSQVESFLAVLQPLVAILSSTLRQQQQQQQHNHDGSRQTELAALVADDECQQQRPVYQSQQADNNNTSQQQQRQQQQQQLSSGDDLHIVDFGCGSGNLLLPLAAVFPGCVFTGVDMKPAALQLLQQRAAAAGLNNVQVGD